MFKLLVVLAIVYIVLKVINTRAKFAEADARREAEEQRLREEAEAEAEDELTREEAVDVEAEVIETAAEDTEEKIEE
jgi:flagellar biosynthesis/type III secretory pathway M-ring protein FliF/YscJ